MPSSFRLRYLGELLGLEFADIFEDALRDYDIEPLVTERDRLLEKIGLAQIQARIVYGDVDAVVLDVGPSGETSAWPGRSRRPGGSAAHPWPAY